MFSNRLWHVLLAVAICWVAIACNSESSEVPTAINCRTVSHALGDTEICGHPQKIVVLGMHSLDLLLSLGEQPAGVDTLLPGSGEERIDPESQIPYLGKYVTTQPANVGSRASPSLEALTQLAPDLIVGESGGHEDTYQLMSQIAPTVLWEVRTQLGQWQENLRTLAVALGDERRADDAIARYDNAIAAAREELQPVISESPTVLLLSANNLVGGNLSAITPRSYLGELMDNLGFEVVSPPSEVNFVPLSLEVLPEYGSVDRIIVLGYNTEALQAAKTGAQTDEILQMQTTDIREDWQGNAIARSLAVSQENRVYFAPYIKWNALNGPIGTELILADLRQFLIED